MKILSCLPAAALAAVFGSTSLFAQTAVTPPFPDKDSAPPVQVISPTATPTPTPRFFRNIVHDQVKIFTSPARIRRSDLEYLVPLAMGTAALIVTDETTSSWVHRGGSLPPVSHAVSYAGSIYATGGIAAGFYLFGRASHDDHARETGRLSAQALIDTVIVTEVLKYAMGRQRPDFGNGEGHFFDHGKSFPSGHASSAWAVATVVSYEYQRHPWIKYGAFAAAAAVSMSRYTGRNHFLSDVLVGSSIGYGIGRFVYKTR